MNFSLGICEVGKNAPLRLPGGSRSGVRGVPDRRTPGALLYHGRRVVWRCNLQADRVVRAPTAGRIFNDASVVKRAGIRLEVRINPRHAEFGRAPIRGDAAIGEIHLSPVIGAAMCLRVRLDPVRANHVIGELVSLSSLGPSFDSLYFLQVSTVGVLRCPDD